MSATDHEISVGAESILDLLTEFDSPRDASSALLLAHVKMITACFPPELVMDAFKAVDEHAENMKKLLKEGWH